MLEQSATIYVVDDDPLVRDGLDSLLRSVGYEVCTFASVDEFARHPRADAPSCLVLDVRMPGPSGLDFQAQLAKSGDAIPVIFLTGHGDVPMSVQAIKAGAVEFLLKPFREQDLLDAIRAGLAKDRAHRLDAGLMAELLDRFATLNAREREVMALVVTGLLNKQIAGELGVSEITVKVNRAQVMRKMKAATLPDLIRMADRLGLAANRQVKD
ncbi:response regulator transcription factor [Mesorhizobium sp. VK25A]|uniref:Response regulator transcription factor n=1 Tax=Mesorhizobium vachelliae TaxID=3072309 RepID=A0ABU5AC93_9HYPH|nr:MULTISPECIES: response regulator transcription factor [unclassified Mesorhizobium]MDX8533846.1 response regulator transcription factor [Mesorhizobium sp. VK25D]MDX8546441.1 response regulator transcription factor [Mesorhizobium sp. VK25A]